MLTELKAYLNERRAASLSEIALHFAADPDALRPMLDQWIRKGKVRRSGGTRCSGCVSCSPADVEFYEWVEPSASAGEHPDALAGVSDRCRS